VNFLAITGSNLDEYVEIRQAGLMQRIEDGYREPGYDGLRPAESLTVLTAEIHKFVAAQYRCWNKQLAPELRKQGIRLLTWNELGEEAAEFARGYFQREVDPLLTPISIDPAHPFPRVLNKALCLALLLRPKRRSSGPQVLGVAQVRPPAQRARPSRLRAPAGDDRAASGRHVPRLRGAGFGVLPRDAQLEPLLRGGRSAVALGDDPRGAA
jgi:polyphosphate kinase